MMQKMSEKQRTIDHNSRKNAFLTGRVGKEEEAKRKTLLRYVDAVKELAAEKAAGGGAILQLPSSSVGDEEVHAIVALLRNEKRVATLNLRDNVITDVGARAIAALLSTTCPLRSVDLRGNKISNNGVRALAEALERCPRVRHVYVHAGNKIEALGTELTIEELDEEEEEGQGTAKTMAVTTICAVDARNNNPEVSENADMEKEMKRDLNQTDSSVNSRMRAVHEDIKKRKGPAARASRRLKAATASARRRKKEKQAWATLSVNDRPLSRSKPSSTDIKRKEKQWPQDRTSRLKEARRILREEKQRREKQKLERGWQGRSGGSDYHREQSQSRRDHDQDTKTTTLPPLMNENNANSDSGRLRIQRPPTAGSAMSDMSSVFERTLESRASNKSVAFEGGMDVTARAAHDAADAVLSPSKSTSPDGVRRKKKRGGNKRRNRAKNFSRRLQNSPLKTM